MTPRQARADSERLGSKTEPGTVAMRGRAPAYEVDAYGFKWDWKGRSSKHIPFD